MNEAPTYGDALSRPFWAAAEDGRLQVQRCEACGHHQFYPRPFCLECEAGGVEWVDVSGRGTVYSLTTVHLKVLEELDPPYLVGLIELEEGPVLLSRMVAADGSPLADGIAIGDPVAVAWHQREGAPPLPVFRPLD